MSLKQEYSLSHNDQNIIFNFGNLSGIIEGVGDIGSLKRSYEKGVLYENNLLFYIEALNLNGVYIDVGGCIGNHAIFMAKFCPSAQVLCFEPNKDLYEVLSKNVVLNNTEDKVIVKNKFVSNDYRDDEGYIRLDDESFNNVVIIKIDVEGSELSVIKSAKKLLLGQTAILFCECVDSEAYRIITEELSHCNYFSSGRVFNHTSTYEFLPSSLNKINTDSLCYVDLLNRLTNAVKSDHGYVVDIPEKGYTYLGVYPEDIKIQNTFDIYKRAFFMLDMKIDKKQDASIRWQFYENEVLVDEQKFSIKNNQMQTVNCPPDTTSIKPLIRVSGALSQLEITKFHLTYFTN